MSFSIYRKTRSVRLTVTTPDGEKVVVENLNGDEGFYLSFECTRAMTAEPAIATVTAHNLPAEVLGIFEAAQTKKSDDYDGLLIDLGLQTEQVDPSGSDALEAGFLIVEVEAGFDGAMSRVFYCIGARVDSSSDSDDVTIVSTIRATENLDGALLGLPLRAFETGSTLFELVDYLRQIAGLGAGNLSYASLTAILGESRLDSPYIVSGGQALAHLTNVLQYLPMRWFIDDREIWICGRDGMPSPTNALPWIADGPAIQLEPIIGRPTKSDGGFVEVACMLCPRVLPGRIVALTPGGLALSSQGLSPAASQVRRAMVPPGAYRCEEVMHRGDTRGGEYRTTMKLRPVTGPEANALFAGALSQDASLVY